MLKLRAKRIAEKESFGNWLSSLEAKGLLDSISSDTDLAVKLYKANPCQETLDYLRKVNPTAAEIVDPSKDGTCELCGKEHVPVFNAKIVDDLGTRYRRICSDCFEKNNASLTK